LKRLSIGLRLTVWYVGIFAVAQLIFGVGMWFILRENLHDVADSSLSSEVEDVRRFLETQRPDATVDELRGAVTEEYSSEAGGDYLQITDADGNWVYRSHAFSQQGIPAIPPNQLRKPVRKDAKFGGKPFRIMSKRIDVRGRTYTVQTAASNQEEIETLERFQNYLLMFAPVLLLAAGCLGYWLSRRALSPVDALTRTARTITGQTLSSRLEQLHTGDELQRLSDTLNEMLARHRRDNAWETPAADRGRLSLGVLVVIARHDHHARPVCLVPQPLVLLEPGFRRKPLSPFPPGQRPARCVGFQLALAGRRPPGSGLPPGALEIFHVHVADVHDAPSRRPSASGTTCRPVSAPPQGRPASCHRAQTPVSWKE